MQERGLIQKVDPFSIIFLNFFSKRPSFSSFASQNQKDIYFVPAQKYYLNLFFPYNNNQIELQ